MDTVKINHGKTKIIAHRGLSGIERENTAAAFVAAGNRSYFGIETDVHKTADGKYIIIHDDRTGRVAIDDIAVEKSGYNQLRSLRLPDIDGKIREDLCLPSLEEYLRICKKYDKVAVLEFKNPFARSDIEVILRIIRNEYKMDKMIMISFVYENLINIREIEKDAALQFLCGCKINDELIEKLLKYRLELDTDYSYLDKENVKKLHANGIKVNCWTVNDKKAAEKLVGMGVDFITTNILE